MPTEDCFSKEDIVSKLLLIPAASAAAPKAAAPAPADQGPQPTKEQILYSLKGLSIRQLRTKIFEAGLSSKGMLEKQVPECGLVLRQARVGAGAALFGLLLVEVVIVGGAIGVCRPYFCF